MDHTASRATKAYFAMYSLAATMLLLVIVVLLDVAASWMTNHPVRTACGGLIGGIAQRYPSAQRATAFAATNNNNNNNNNNDYESSNLFPDEDCYDLCDDMDWDNKNNMPLSFNNNNNDESSVVETESIRTTMNNEDDAARHHRKPLFQRMRLEMEWELRQNQEDCNVEEIDTCGEFCLDCVGAGSVQCRFCHGGGRLHLPPTNLYGGSQVQACPVCNEGGMEVCKTCRGSGRIAPWTSYSTT